MNPRSLEWKLGNLLQYLIPSVNFSPMECENCVSILVLGQSNAANHGSGRIFTRPLGLSFYNKKFYPLIDPSPGCSGYGASPWPRVAYELNVIKKKLVLICLAQGGTSVKDWLPGKPLNNALKHTVNEYQRIGGKIDHVVWHQGETDSFNCVSKEIYRTNVNTVLDSVVLLVPDAVVLFAMATWPNQRFHDCRGVKEAQMDTIRIREGLQLLHDFDELDDKFRFDGVHFNKLGLDVYASAVIKAIDK